MNMLRTGFAITAIYGYFRLFAQFAFLEGSALGEDAGHGLKILMAAMGLGGVLGCVLTPRLVETFGARTLLRIGFLVCGFTALVTLAGTLRQTVSPRRAGLVAGLGTGLAYAFCNISAFFQATWQWQTGAVVLLAGLAAVFVPTVPRNNDFGPPKSASTPTIPRQFWFIVFLFLSLVWLDSAAFYIIQHTAVLKKATWGSDLLWRNAALHFFGALAAGLALDRGWLLRVLLPALALLSVASQWVGQPAFAALSGWLYPLGVSLYSVALVVYPGCLSGARTSREALPLAARLFGLAGWIGSALGVGMAANLHLVPPWFVFAVWLGAAAVLCHRFRLPGRHPAVVLVVLSALLAWSLATPPSTNASPVSRGQAVYLSEGCIHCHSRYVRPRTADELLWGPSRSIPKILQDAPVLIGNRRQGPDLLQVGLRRSPKWMELHFLHPQLLSPGSVMPPYLRLWDDDRGADLIAFLTNTTPEEWSSRLETIAAWTPSDPPPAEGATLFALHCAACHGEAGRGDGPLARHFQRPPANLNAGPFLFSNPAPNGPPLRETLARIAKFGLPGTDMPGHETLTDAEVLGLAEHLLSLRSSPHAP
ncbi:MAG: cbb3-type cytochrome c oxidase subunit II [Verrucomicrobia bacterium]|nr:cbb3-type cytochrome c oxidase subunit II [Verrucomicrobiota bacterium]